MTNIFIYRRDNKATPPPLPNNLDDGEVSGICDIIDGTIDTIREWESDEAECKREITYWVDILEKLDPDRAVRWHDYI